MRKINSETWIVSFIMGLCIVFSMSAGVRGYGDGYSYCLMVDSLMKDGDLKVEKEDIVRWKNNKFDNIAIGAHVFFDKKGTPRYAKPFLYPLISIPFYFFGGKGFSLLNGLFLGGSIVFCYFFIRKYFNKINSMLIAMLFFFCSYIPVYVSWIHSEMMLFFACSLCMWLFFCKNKSSLAALIIGIVSSVKIVFLLLLVPFFAVMIFEKEYKKLSKSLAVFILGIGFILSLNFLLFGQLSPYSGVNRGFFVSKAGESERVEEMIYPVTAIDSQFEGFEFNSWKLFFRNLGNFFIGRFTGIIWYGFPGVGCIGLYLLKRRHLVKEERKIGDNILLAAIALVLVLIIARPLNYFGGKGFVCNRYFFILPALLFLPLFKAFKNPKIIMLLFLPGLLINFNIITSEVFAKSKSFYYKKYSNTFIPGVYACAFPLRHFPLELTQIESLPVSKIKISENRSFYFPLGFKEKNDKGILIDKEQEIVIVQRGKENFILKTDRKNLSLKPAIKLKSRLSEEYKSFYYFKAKQLTLINNAAVAK